jgi:hypothetical protein
VNWAVMHGGNARRDSVSVAIGAGREWKRIVTASSSCTVYCGGSGGFRDRLKLFWTKTHATPYLVTLRIPSSRRFSDLLRLLHPRSRHQRCSSFNANAIAIKDTAQRQEYSQAVPSKCTRIGRLNFLFLLIRHMVTRTTLFLVPRLHQVFGPNPAHIYPRIGRLPLHSRLRVAPAHFT